MNNAAPGPDAPAQPETQPPSLQPEPVTFEAYRSILRLLIGLALAGSDDLLARLREWETGHAPGPAGEPEPGGNQARRALIGLAFETADTVKQVVSAASQRSASFAGSLRATLRPVADSFLFRPLHAPVQAIVRRGEDRFERYVRTGRAEEPRSRKLAGEVTGLLMEDVVGYAGENPGVKALVDAQVERLLPALVADATIQALLVEQLGTWIGGLATRPESLDPLVREVGDRYIAYLNEHPDDVQNLVQGQAVGMAAEVRDNVRTITVTGDSSLEAAVRAILRRKPRQDLPPPPPEVQRWATVYLIGHEPGRPQEETQ
jgi:hypothetical protein